MTWIFDQKLEIDKQFKSAKYYAKICNILRVMNLWKKGVILAFVQSGRPENLNLYRHEFNLDCFQCSLNIELQLHQFFIQPWPLKKLKMYQNHKYVIEHDKFHFKNNLSWIDLNFGALMIERKFAYLFKCHFAKR